MLNLGKTKIMLVGTHQSTIAAEDLVINISNTCLDRVYHTLSWKDHVEYIGNKISPRLGILRRAHKVLPKSTCLMLHSLRAGSLWGPRVW